MFSVFRMRSHQWTFMRITIVLSLICRSGATFNTSSSSSSNSKYFNTTSSSSSSIVSLSISSTSKSSTLSTTSKSTIASVPTNSTSKSTSSISSTYKLTASPTVKSNNTSGNGTATIPSSITPCAATPLTLFDIINPEVFLLPPDEWVPFIQEEFASLNKLYATFVRIQAEPSSLITNSASFVSYSSSVANELQTIISAVLGPNGFPALLAFHYLDKPCVFSSCTQQFLDAKSAFKASNPASSFNPFDYKVQAPCCGRCTVYGQGVQLSYFPTPAPQSAPATLVDAANNTYVSPSVYAVFTGLSAIDLCGNVGNTYGLKTFTFGNTELSTSKIPTGAIGLDPTLGNWTAINYGDFGPQCTCTANCVYDPILGRTLDNLCTPQISIPTQVSTLDPLWATCDPNLGGVFDPPVALSVAGGLSAPKNVPANPTPNNPVPNPPNPTGPVPVPVVNPTPPGPAPTQPPANPPQNNPPPPVPVNPQPSQAPPNNPPNQNPPPNNPPQNNPPQNNPPQNNPPQNNPSQNNPPQNNPPPNNPLPQNTPVPLNNPPSPSLANPPPTPAAVAPSNFAVVVGGSTAFVPAPTPGAASPAVITVNGQPFTANPQGNFIVSGQTLSPGGAVITVAGTPISLGVVPGSTPGPVITVNGQTVSANAQGNFVVGSQTLTPGGAAITVAGTPISLPAGSSASAITINGQVITADAQGNFVIGTQTLTPGGPGITVSGTPISLAPSASEVVVGGTTRSMGDIIISMFTAPDAGPTGSSVSAAAPAQYTGGARSTRQVSFERVVFVAVLAVMVI